MPTHNKNDDAADDDPA